MNAKEIIRRHYQKIGAKGGSAGTGRAKARSSAVARRAVKVRWAKAKALQRARVRKENGSPRNVCCPLDPLEKVAKRAGAGKENR